MSFSKAKIQRFNEVTSEAPPPGAYDPKFDNKVKGLVIEKSDRFLDTKSACSAEYNASMSGKSNGVISIPAFRTPQMPRKMLSTKPAGASCKAKIKLETPIRTQSMKYESSQHLADLEVECLNKDKTIQEQEKYIEEMKEDVQKLQAELEELSKKQIETEQQHTKDIETMAKLQQEVLINHNKKHEAETQILRSQLLEVSEEKEREFSTRKKIESELRKRAAELSKRITTLEVELRAKKEQNRMRKVALEMRIAELANTLEKMEHDRDTQIELLRKEKDMLDINVANLTEERSNLEVKLEKRQNVILRLQSQLSTLQCELDELKAEYEKLADDSIKRICDLTDKHEEEIKCLKDCLAKEKEELIISNDTLQLNAEAKIHEIEETNFFLTKELKDVQRLYKDVSHRLCEAQKELERANDEHAFTMEQFKDQLIEMKYKYAKEKLELEQSLKLTKEKYSKLENITKARDKEFDDLKQASEKKIEEEKKRMKEHAQKMIENAETVTREMLAACRAESEERVKRTIVECDAKVNAMIREAQNAVEEEMQLAAERYKACLARMEMERATLDEKLSQRDTEVTKLSATLEELRSSVETQESFSQSLQVELDKAETELAEKKEELRALKDHIRTEAAEMVGRRKRFEVIMAENQASVVALTNRLAQSNAEVERLQHELKRGEDCIHEHKDLLSAMRNNSQLVHEQVRTLMEELDAQRELVDQLEAESLSEFEAIKPIFEAKVENLKQITAKEITRLKDDCEKKSLQNDELKKQLDDMANNLREAQDLLLKLEERNDTQAVNISRMELVNSKLTEQLRSREKALEESNQLVQVKETQYKKVIDEANSRIEKLSGEVKLLENNKNHSEEIAELLEQEKNKWKTTENALKQQIEEERTRREEAEEEAKKIAELNSRLMKDFEDISGKYAEMIGHQNPKQRIKHVAQLKDKIYQLEQELSTKTRLIEQQQKTIEKLKAEEKRSHWKGKENNIGMLHSTPISSPHKTLPTPLRSRND